MCSIDSADNLYCVVVLVFFFKQKTAYEMRISDWSSDVCSSELGERHQEAKKRAEQDGGKRARRHIARVVAWRGAGKQGIEHDEIGRASCRERVCQYV